MPLWRKNTCGGVIASHQPCVTVRYCHVFSKASIVSQEPYSGSGGSGGGDRSFTKKKKKILPRHVKSGVDTLRKRQSARRSVRSFRA